MSFLHIFCGLSTCININKQIEKFCKHSYKYFVNSFFNIKYFSFKTMILQIVKHKSRCQSVIRVHNVLDRRKLSSVPTPTSEIVVEFPKR